MCSVTETFNAASDEVEWLYGLYIDTVEEFHTYDGFTDCSEQYDRILHNGHIVKVDNYWYLERVS